MTGTDAPKALSHAAESEKAPAKGHHQTADAQPRLALARATARDRLALLRRPGIARAFAPYVISRIGSAGDMIAILLLLTVRQSAAVGALVVAVYTLASAVGALISGWLASRFAVRQVLVVAGATHLAVMVGLVLVADKFAPSLVMGALAGLTLPPISAFLRAHWTALLDEGKDRQDIYYLEGMALEALEIGSPLLVGVLVLFGAPAAAVLVCAASITVSAWWAGSICTGAPAEPPPASDSATAFAADSRGAKVPSRAVVLGPLVMYFVFSASFGPLQTGVVAAVPDREHIAAFILTSFAVGSLCAALFAPTGARGIGRRLTLLFTFFASGLGLLAGAAASGNVLLLTGAAFVAGLGCAPCFAGLLESAAEAGAGVSRFSAVTAANTAGLAAGFAVSGQLLEFGASTTLLAGAGVVLACAVATPMVHRVAPGPRQPTSPEPAEEAR